MLTQKLLLNELAIVDGTIWKEVVGEVQPQYNEVVFWILLYEDSDLQLAHEKFCEIVAPQIDNLAPLQIALFY
jgi:hypothetical protein